MYDPTQRLLELEEGFQQYPGRRPGGSGITGIGHARALGGLVGPPSRQTLQDYSRMLEEQQEYMQLVGNEPTRVSFSRQPPNPALAGLLGAGETNPFMLRPRRMNPSWTTAPKYNSTAMPEPHNDFMKRYGR